MDTPLGAVQEIRPGIFAWMNSERGWGASNSALIAGSTSSLLIDTQWDLPRTAAMLDAFAPHTRSAPVTTLLNTHADGDHWFGNCLVDAATRLATRKTARAMAQHGPRTMKLLGRSIGLMRALGNSWRIAADYIDRMLAPFDFRTVRPAYPNQTFDTSFEMNQDGRRIEIHEFGPAHTSSDSMVYLPDDGVLIAADLLFIGVIPVIWEGSSRNWIEACDWMIGKRPGHIVPGHGPLSDAGGAEILRGYLDLLRSQGRKEFKNGRDPLSAARQILASSAYQRQPFACWDGQERMAINLHSLFRRLSGEDSHMSTLARLRALRDAALLAEENQGLTGSRA